MCSAYNVVHVQSIQHGTCDCAKCVSHQRKNQCSLIQKKNHYLSKVTKIYAKKTLKSQNNVCIRDTKEEIPTTLLNSHPFSDG